MRRQYSHRPAFTLTEMMVATALILFIMAIISTAFRSGLDTFSKLNTVGKLQEQLVNSQRIIQRDLAADHFGNTNADGYHGPRLSDQRLDRVNWTPPTQGYFIAWQKSLATVEQSSLADAEGLTSTRNTQSFLRFTVKLRNDTPPYDIPMYRFAQSVIAPKLDRTQYPDSILDPIASGSGVTKYYVTSNWAQVEYFLVPTGTSTDAPSSLPLYSLRRKTQLSPGNAPGASSPARSVPSTGPTSTRLSRTYDPTPSSTGDDILLVNVISFEVKFLWSGSSEYGGNVKHPVNPIAAALPLPFTAANITPGVSNSQAMNDSADWPYSDLPADISRTTLPNDGTTRTPSQTLAWPGVGSRYIDEAPFLYYDSWFDPSTSPLPSGVPSPGPMPNWGTPPVEDRWASGSLNPNATLPNQPPLRIRVKAVQVKLRIWDEKTGQTRQITFMQEV